MATIIFPLSRIEGHAQVSIEVADGQVKSAHFQASELRGFENFVKGVPAEQMVVIVPRICGVCSTAHHVAAVEALEDAFGVSPPPLALKIRELLLLGQMIQNQATSLFLFTMPDRLRASSLFQAAGDQLAEPDREELAKCALKVRKTGTDLIKTAGGQFIHPVKAVIGGVVGGVPEDQAVAARDQVADTLPQACKLFDYYVDKSMALRERIGTWGDDAPACYIAAVSETRPDYCGDYLRILHADGNGHETFPAKDFRSYLTYEDTDYSYAGKTSFRGEVLRAGSLARINLASSLGTPLADEYLTRFREAFGQPAHAILLFDLARGIELVYSLERALEILSEPLDREETEVGYTPRDGEGFGLVEAPRGPLIHNYVIEHGKIARADFVIPTVHNVMAIERALRVAAERYITSDQVNLELERAVGRVVRAFDPCIACATH
jgi:coenzyme F420-reducing hydrogenase alpha subunit